MKLLLLIRALSTGGAERQVAVLAKGLRERGHEVSVVVYYGGGALEGDLANADVPLICLEKKGRWDIPGFLWRLVRIIRRERPDAIYSWLSVANILAAVIRPLLPPVKVVWALRASNMDLGRYDWLTGLTTRIETRLAGLAHLVIANSHAGRDCALANGFPPAKLRVVPNGIDTVRFHSDRELGYALRTKWGVAGHEVLIGLVGRLDPMKGHPVFLQAAARLREWHPEARFVCVGEGATSYTRLLRLLAGQYGLDDRLTWLGNRLDMPAVYNALDIAVSASVYGEGVSNSICEAMACGVPCVVTAVGDSARVVGDTGAVVPPENAEALTEELARMRRKLPEEGPELSRQARLRIERDFSVDALVKNTLDEIEGLL